MHIPKGTVALAATFSLVLPALVYGDPISWQMETQKFDSKPLGELRSQGKPRVEPLSNERGHRKGKSAFSTERPPVINIGPLREPRAPLHIKPRHDR